MDDGTQPNTLGEGALSWATCTVVVLEPELVVLGALTKHLRAALGATLVPAPYALSVRQPRLAPWTDTVPVRTLVVSLFCRCHGSPPHAQVAPRCYTSSIGPCKARKGPYDPSPR